MAGSPAENKARVVVSTEWAIFFIGLLAVVILFAVFAKDSRRHNRFKWKESDAETEKLIIGIVVAAVFITLGLNLLLTIGVYKKRRLTCSIWYGINLISTVCVAINLLLTVGGLFSGTSNLGVVGINSLAFTYRFICGKYVGKYIEELRLLQLDTHGELRLAFTHSHSHHQSNQNVDKIEQTTQNKPNV